jgi:ribosome-associated protein
VPKKAAPKKPTAKKAALKKLVTVTPKKTTAVKVKSRARPKATPRAKKVKDPSARLLTLILSILDDGKALDVFVIDLAGKSSMADCMVVASGGSSRQINALAEKLMRSIKTAKFGSPGVEGLSQGDWVLIDAGDIIVHLFRPEIRAFYNLEKMWEMALPDDGQNAVLGG